MYVDAGLLGQKFVLFHHANTTHAVAYLEFQKMGKFSLATSAYTKVAEPGFSISSYGKTIVLPKRAMAQWPPPEYASEHTYKLDSDKVNLS